METTSAAEAAAVVWDPQQVARISQFVAFDESAIQRLFEQLAQGGHSVEATRFITQLDIKASQSSGSLSDNNDGGQTVNWKVVAEESKAQLATDKINFEQRLQQCETKINAFKSQQTTLRQKLATVSLEREQEATKAKELEQKLTTQQSGSMHSTVEMESFKARIETLEIEKRETVSLLERKTNDLDNVNEDYQSLLTKYQEAKKEISQSESEAQTAKASEMTHKLQKQAMDQELELLKQRLEWANSELEAKSTEFGQYRSEKSSQVLKLQSELSQALLDTSTASQSNAVLQRRVQEQQQKLEAASLKTKELLDQNVLQEEQFKGEMETTRRLSILWERESKDNKTRVDDLEQTLDDMQRRLSSKDRNQQEIVDKFSEEKLQLQVKIEEGQVEIEKLKTQQKRADELLAQAGLADNSGSSSEFNLGRMGMLSPTAALAGRMQKTGMSLTQVYSLYMDLQGDHARLQSENAHLQQTMDDIAQELANSAPMIREQQQEYQRLKAHAEDMSRQWEVMAKEKDALALGAKEALVQLDTVVAERDLLHKENQDLDREVQNLLWRIQSPNAPQSQIPEEALNRNTVGMTDAERVIEEHLVLFSTVQELQQQNKQLRQIARQLSQAREEQDLAKVGARKKEQNDVLEEAAKAINSLREDLANREMQLAALGKEVEMLRRILKTSGDQGAVDGGLRNGSARAQNGSPAMPANYNIDMPQHAALVDQLQVALNEMQQGFDAYRKETGDNSKVIKEQVTKAETENSEYRIQLARASTQIDMLNERYQMLMQNSTHQTTEVAELRKRAAALQEVTTRHEISNQKLSSDLYTAKDANTRLQSEIANLKTEKNLWKSFENRLLEENQALVKEKGHLNELLRTVQNMANEVERGTEQSRRRLETSVATREHEVATLKEKLKEEVEAGQQLRDRKEMEAREWRTKFDAQTAEYQKSREDLIQAKTALEHTTAKAEDLTNQIKSREEQLAIYQQKPSGAGTEEATREEKLEAQANQLRADLVRVQAEADMLRQHVAQLKSISQANEDQLSSLSTTFDEYKAEVDRKTAEKDESIKSLESKLASAEERAARASEEMVETQNKMDEERAQWRNTQDTLSARIAHLENMESQYTTMETRFRDDLRVQATAAKEAHENYERELINHAKDMAALSKLKEEHSQVTLELEQFKTKADSAVSNLQASELAWEGQRNILQKTLSEVEKRCAELKEQNDKLHAHMEDVSAQAMSIQQRMNAPMAVVPEEGVDGSAEAAAAAVKGSLEHQMLELRDVIRFVRREKDILECQHELTLQESRRLKQQLEQTNRSLEEARQNLVEERNRQQEVMVSKQQHDQLLEKINQLSLLRESNSTLRAENEKLTKRVEELEQIGQGLQAKLTPLADKVRELETELEFSKKEQAQVSEDRDRWRTRTQQIMQKYDRIDPAELQELKDELEKLKASTAEKETAFQAEKDELEKKYIEERDRYTKIHALGLQWRNRTQATNALVRERDVRITELEAKIKEESEKNGGMDTMVRERDNLQKSMDLIQKAKDKLESDNRDLTTNKEQIEKAFEELKQRFTNQATKSRAMLARLKEREAELKTLKDAHPEGGAAGGATAPTAAETQQAIEAAVKAKEVELEAKHTAQQQVAVRAAQQQAQQLAQQAIAQAKANSASNGGGAGGAAALEAERVKLTQELEAKHQTALANHKQETELRQQLKLQGKDKEIKKLKDLLAASGVPVAGGAMSNTGSPAGSPAPAHQATLSPNAQPFRPASPSLAATPTMPGQPQQQAVRPFGRVFGNAASNAGPGMPVRPNLGQGQQNRLRQQPGVRPPAPAATAATVATTAAGAAAATIPARMVNIKRRGTAANLVPQTPGAVDSLGLTSPPPVAPDSTVENAAAANANTAAASALPATGNPVALRRKRPTAADSMMPSPSDNANVAATTATGTPVEAPTSERPNTVQPQREGGAQEEEIVATPAEGEPAVTAVLAAAAAAAAATSSPPPTGTSTPHGQKRRHESTENAMEIVAVVSTPGDTGALDQDEEMFAGAGQEDNNHGGAHAMEVDDLPPVKRPRPTSHVELIEMPDGTGSGGEDQSPASPAPMTPGVTGDLGDDGVLDDHDEQAAVGGSGVGDVDGGEAGEIPEDEEHHHQDQDEHHQEEDDLMVNTPRADDGNAIGGEEDQFHDVDELEGEGGNAGAGGATTADEEFLNEDGALED